MCSNKEMRWSSLSLQNPSDEAANDNSLPGLSLSEIAPIPGHIRSVRAPEFQGIVFHEVLAKSALNRAPSQASMPFEWTINPYRGCSHACVYCFARGSHRYLDLDAGQDFDSQIIVKVNIAEVLERELAKPSWLGKQVSLGTNTDPYQRAEGRYKLIPGIIDSLTASGTSLSILTKGTLLRRDLPQLAEASQQVHVNLAMSIAIGDKELQQSVEPGTPSTRARLETIAAARDHGFGCSVFMMPILPYLTDSTSALIPLLRDIRDAGANSVLYSPLHLREYVKPWFFAWLKKEHPDLLPRYQKLYPGKTSRAPKEYRKELAARIKPLIRRFGLEQPRNDLRTSPSTTALETLDRTVILPGTHTVPTLF